jgi:putative tRNA adenosine deaminase-associated protein
VSYFTAVVARDGRKWFAHDLDVESMSDLAEVADEMRIVANDEEPVLLLVEREDAWWGLVRVDGEDDPRVFVSDASGVRASRYAPLLDLETGDGDEEPAVRVGACAGDFDVLADMGTSAEALQEMCEDEMLPMDALATVAEGAGFGEVLDSLR